MIRQLICPHIEVIAVLVTQKIKQFVYKLLFGSDVSVKEGHKPYRHKIKRGKQGIFY